MPLEDGSLLTMGALERNTARWEFRLWREHQLLEWLPFRVPFPAGRASWRRDPVSALRYRGRLIHERVKGVAANF